MFRSRDNGEYLDCRSTPGLFIGGGISLAVSPADPNHLLYATDTRLLRSRNGGRDWKQDGGALLFGPTLAVAFDARWQGAVASTAAGVFWTERRCALAGQRCASRCSAGASPSRSAQRRAACILPAHAAFT